MRVLCVAAHPDDEVLGCGGTLARLAVDPSNQVSVLLAGRGRTGQALPAPPMVSSATNAALALGIQCGFFDRLMLRDQCFDAVDRLDIVMEIERYVERIRPDEVYTHHIGDRNLDHRIIADAVFTACRPLPNRSVRLLLSFEVPSSTEWGDGFVPNVFVDISGDAHERKLKALEAYGEEACPPWPHARSLQAVVGREVVRGASVGVTAAEAFMLIREVR